LSGGTIESKSPDSWFEFEYHDGSTVTITGISTLTFSDHGQKNLYLKEGNVFVNAKPQSASKPMLIYTQTAILEVVGTQFEAEAEPTATMLSVSEGKVRIKRLSDGVTVDVPAQHRVVAADDRDMQPVPVPEVVGQWKSQLHLGPEGTYGKWSPRTAAEEAKLKIVPLTISQGLTIYVAAVEVSRGDTPPVVLRPGCRLRARGHIASPHEVYFGVGVRYVGGGFAGKFQTIRPSVEFFRGEDFEVLLDLRDFRLDPSLTEMKDNLPSAPFHLVVESAWFHTLDQPSGLEITEVELLPPTTSGDSVPTETSQHESSQGALENAKMLRQRKEPRNEEGNHQSTLCSAGRRADARHCHRTGSC
ncbi:MAG: FecR domain-containing protein, partial [Phycisphaerales bacterium]